MNTQTQYSPASLQYAVDIILLHRTPPEAWVRHWRT